MSIANAETLTKTSLNSPVITLSKMIELLNDDLTRESSHMHFYLNASIVVRGPHREEFGEMFREEAQSEMNHVTQFAKLILGLGGKPTTLVADFRSDITCATTLVEEAMSMEKEVIANYVDRIEQAVALQENGGDDRIHGRYIEIFLEEQLIHSRSDVDNYREMLDRKTYVY